MIIDKNSMVCKVPFNLPDDHIISLNFLSEGNIFYEQYVNFKMVH